MAIEDVKAFQGTQISPEQRVTNNIVRLSNEDGSAGSGLKITAADFLFRGISKTKTELTDLLASDGSGITVNQSYVMSDIGATHAGLAYLVLTGCYKISGGDTIKSFSPIARVYINDLGREIDCEYDLATDQFIGGGARLSFDISSTDITQHPESQLSVTSLLNPLPGFYTAIVQDLSSVFDFPRFNVLQKENRGPTIDDAPVVEVRVSISGSILMLRVYNYNDGYALSNDIFHRITIQFPFIQI